MLTYRITIQKGKNAIKDLTKTEYIVQCSSCHIRSYIFECMRLESIDGDVVQWQILKHYSSPAPGHRQMEQTRSLLYNCLWKRFRFFPPHIYLFTYFSSLIGVFFPLFVIHFFYVRISLCLLFNAVIAVAIAPLSCRHLLAVVVVIALVIIIIIIENKMCMFMFMFGLSKCKLYVYFG